MSILRAVSQIPGLDTLTSTKTDQHMILGLQCRVDSWQVHRIRSWVPSASCSGHSDGTTIAIPLADCEVPELADPFRGLDPAPLLTVPDCQFPWQVPLADRILNMDFIGRTAAARSYQHGFKNDVGGHSYITAALEALGLKESPEKPESLRWGNHRNLKAWGLQVHKGVPCFTNVQLCPGYVLPEALPFAQLLASGVRMNVGFGQIKTWGSEGFSFKMLMRRANMTSQQHGGATIWTPNSTTAVECYLRFYRLNFTKDGRDFLFTVPYPEVRALADVLGLSLEEEVGQWCLSVPRKPDAWQVIVKLIVKSELDEEVPDSELLKIDNADRVDALIRADLLLNRHRAEAIALLDQA